MRRSSSLLGRLLGDLGAKIVGKRRKHTRFPKRAFSIEPLEARTLLSIGPGTWTGNQYVPSSGAAVSSAGVRYADGDVVLSVSDLAGVLTRSYGTRPWAGMDQGV